MNELESITCWDGIHRPFNQKMMHSMFVFLRKRDVNGNVKRHREILFDCGNDENDDYKNIIPLSSEFYSRNINNALSSTKGFHSKVL